VHNIDVDSAISFGECDIVQLMIKYLLTLCDINPLPTEFSFWYTRS